MNSEELVFTSEAERDLVEMIDCQEFENAFNQFVREMEVFCQSRGIPMVREIGQV